MLVILAEKPAQILDWLKTAADYQIVESNWKVLDLPYQHHEFNNRSLRRSSYTGSLVDEQSVADAIPHLTNLIPLTDKMSFMWLANLSGSAKEDLHRSLSAIDDQDVLVLGISYGGAQSLASCRAVPKSGSHTLPRCRTYRLRKVELSDNPRDTLSAIVDRANRNRVLYFTRHGESEYNVSGKVGGNADLSPRGRKYAECLAEYVNRTFGQNPNFRLWTSCLKRTIQTAKDIKAPKENLEALNELDTGVCDGLTYEEIAERFPTEFAARDDDKFHYRYPEGESYSDLLHRVKPVLARLKVEDNVMVVSHQAVLRCILGSLLNKNEEELPYINAPLHTIMRLSYSSADGAGRLDLIPLSIECVDTHRAKPQNCSRTRSAEEALVTVPAHF